MDYLPLGRSDLRVSVIGLGAWQFGDKDWGWGKEYSKEDALQVLNRAFELGINLVDTAEVYGDGISEEVVGDAIRKKRNEVFVATKVAAKHLRYDDVLKTAEESLRRLHLREIDLYQVHWPNYYVPLSETMRALKKLVSMGKVRHVGVSNFPLPLLREAQSFVEIVSNQMRYNLLQREVETEILPYMRREKITLIAFSPLAQGLLTGKYIGKDPPSDGIRSQNPLFSKPENLRQVVPLLRLQERIGRERMKNAAQVALNWVAQRKGVIAIPGAKSVKQVEENVGAIGWRLNRRELSEIEDEYRKIKIDYF